MKKALKFISITTILVGLFVLLSNIYVNSFSSSTYNSVTEMNENRVGLLLGTRKTLSNGNINLYYKYRIDATAELFHANKIDYVLVSGDNGNVKYDEPTDMKNDLIARGIPESKIYLDYAGFRTLDSVVRAKEIFGQTELTVISQQFHNERAICIANSKGINAIGFNATTVSRRYGLKVMVREVLARTKMVIDLCTGVQPKFLGEKINIT